MRERKNLDKVKGALYGVAIGDALGATVEFMSEAQIKARYGVLRDIVGGGWLRVRPGEVTDDTEMTLAVAEGIVKCPADPVKAIGRNFIKWLESSPRDVGSTCALAISTAKSNGGDWFRASEYTHAVLRGKSGGNGTLMRTVYPALWYHDEVDAMEKASDISEMTHWAHEAGYACMCYTEIIWNLVNKLDADVGEVIAEALIASEYDIEELSGDFIYDPSGYVVDSFKCALHAILTTNSLEDAIVKAVNFGGDADTIGAITGGLAGAIYGFNAIPDRWVQKLDKAVKAKLDKLARVAVEHE